MFKLIPWWVKGLVVLSLIAGLAYLGHRAVEHWREQGRHEVQVKWDASVEKGKKEIARLQAQANRVSTKIEVEYVDRIKTVTVKGDTIIKYRDRFVPSDSGMLSGGFRVYYNAAFENRIPDPAEIAKAAPVAVTDVADTTAINGKLCNVAYETVAGWQKWADEQCKLNTKGCPDGQ